jgi:hypothetical protein
MIDSQPGQRSHVSQSGLASRCRSIGYASVELHAGQTVSDRVSTPHAQIHGAPARAHD